VHETVALADEELRRLLRQVNSDVQASLALGRATLQAVASLSAALGDAVEAALDQELDLARGGQAAQRTIDHLEDVRARVHAIPAQLEMMSAMTRALVAAANALPTSAKDAARCR
jgi:hypothetical protein